MCSNRVRIVRGSSLACAGAALIVMSGCFTLTTVTIGTKTSLERQLIGELEPLSEEEVLAASVRAQGGVGIGSRDELQAAAIAARRRQLFNRPDIEEAKKLGCLGEAKDATLAVRACAAAAAGSSEAARFESLVREENADRVAIIDWALANDPALSPADRPQVVQLYRQLLGERAATGDWVEKDDGTWVKR